MVDRPGEQHANRGENDPLKAFTTDRFLAVGSLFVYTSSIYGLTYDTSLWWLGWDTVFALYSLAYLLSDIHNLKS